MTGKESIYVYNKKGKLISKFGRVSETMKKLKNVPPSRILNPLLVTYKNYIFETDYPDYHIRKYDVQGHFIKEFGVKPKHWRSLLKSNYRSLPTPQMVTPAIMKKLKKYSQESKKYSKLRWIEAFEPGILCIMTQRTIGGSFEKGTYFTFYDTEGNLIADGLTFKNYPYKQLPLTYSLPMRPRGLCIVKFLTDITKEPVKGKEGETNVDIIVLRLKTKGQ